MTEPTGPQTPLVECRFTPRPPAEGLESGVVFEERAFFGHFNVRANLANQAALAAIESVLSVPLPLIPNTVSTGRDVVVLWLGPDEWLVITEPDERERVGEGLEAALEPHFNAVNDVSGAQTIISLAGARALDTLAKGCPLDLHPRVFAPGHCAQTRLAKTAVIVRPMPSNMPRFDVVVRRSFADYLWRWLQKAAAEYGYGVVQPSRRRNARLAAPAR